MAERTGHPETDDVLARTESVSANLVAMSHTLGDIGQPQLAAMIKTAEGLVFAVGELLRERT